MTAVRVKRVFRQPDQPPRPIHTAGRRATTVTLARLAASASVEKARIDVVGQSDKRVIASPALAAKTSALAKLASHSTAAAICSSPARA